ncbi:MAG: FtsX-like permease family protein [Gammaproteobacteria bacterium]
MQLDTAWVDRFRAMLDISRRAVDLATALLALAVIVVIGNTIRLEINNRHREIEVTKLVGGSNAFIRRPFLYLGLWYGLGGGLLAWILISVGLRALSAPVAQLAGLYTSTFTLAGLPWLESLALVGGGGLLGWLGAGLAASRHLAAIEPQ